MITDNKIEPNAFVARRCLTIPVVIAQSVTKGLLFRYSAPGTNNATNKALELRRLAVCCRALTANLSLDAFLADADGTLAAPTLAIDATAEKFKTTAVFRGVVNDTYVEKAATTAIVFSAAHVVTASKFGIILVQIDGAGAITTKVPASPQAYNSAALALAALPTADTGKRAIGYIAIAAKAATWTANTDDLTNGSDLTTATFHTNPTDLVSALNAAVVPVAQKEIDAVLATTRTNRINHRGGSIFVIYTSDGTAAITGGLATLEFSTRPLAGKAQ